MSRLWDMGFLPSHNSNKQEQPYSLVPFSSPAIFV